MRKPLSKGECRRTLVIGPWVSAAKYLLLVLSALFFFFFLAAITMLILCHLCMQMRQGTLGRAPALSWSPSRGKHFSLADPCDRNTHACASLPVASVVTVYCRCFAAKTYGKQGIPPSDVLQHPTVSVDGWRVQEKHGSICTKALKKISILEVCLFIYCNKSNLLYNFKETQSPPAPKILAVSNYTAMPLII